MVCEFMNFHWKIRVSKHSERSNVDLARSFFLNAKALQVLSFNANKLRHKNDKRERFRGSLTRIRRGCVVACKSQNVNVDQSARDLIYGRITSQRSAEMALRYSLSAARSSSLNCVRFMLYLPGVNRRVLLGSSLNLRKKI